MTLKIPRTKAPHQTRVRPDGEPYDIHRARQRAQQKELKKYLRGFPIWTSGTYVMPLCPLCNHKEKRCTCLKGEKL